MPKLIPYELYSLLIDCLEVGMAGNNLAGSVGFVGLFSIRDFGA